MAIALTTLLALTGCLGLQRFDTPDSGTPAGGDDTGPTYSTFGGMTYPDAVDFGVQPLGEAVSQDIVLVNDSGSNVTLDQLEFDLPAAYSTEATSVPWVIGAGGQYVITVTFYPTSPGAADGSINFGLEGVDGLGEIAITGEGENDSADGGSAGDGGADGGSGGDGGAGGLDFSTTRIDFGPVPVGSSDSETITITNDSGSTVTISSVTPSSSVFSTTGLTAPTDIAAGSSKSLQVHFAPTAGTTYNEIVTVASSLGSTVIAVSGQGDDSCSICAPIIDIDAGASSTSMEFYSVLGIPDTQSVRIGNVGDEDLQVTNVYVTNDSMGGSYSVSGWTGSRTVAPSSSFTINVSYTCSTGACLDVPDLLGADTNTLHIQSNDTSRSDWQIELNGAGIGL